MNAPNKLLQSARSRGTTGPFRAFTVVVLVLCGLARAQEPKPKPEPAAVAAVRRAIAAAETALGAKRQEAAILSLREARNGCTAIAVASTRDELIARIEALVAKADPVARALADAERDAATKVVAVAKMYEAKGWNRMALRYALAAARIEPDIPRDLVVTLRERLATTKAPVTGDAFDEWFADGEVVGPDAKVALEEASIRVIYLPAGNRPFRFVTHRRARTSDLAMAVDVTAAGDGGFGVVFAYRDSGDFHAVHVATQGTSATVSVVRFRGGSYATLCEREITRSPGRTRVALRVSGKSVVATVGTEGLECELADPAPDGFLGVTAWHTGDVKFQPVFANLHVDAAPFVPRLVRERTAADADAADEEPDDEQNQVAALKARSAEFGSAPADDEGTAVQLHDLRHRISRVAEEADRRALSTIVEKAIGRADPIDASARKVLDAAARSLLRPAQEYARRKWHVASLLPFQRAAAISQNVGAKPFDDAWRAAGYAAGRLNVLDTWLGGASTFAGGGYWRTGPFHIESPTLDSTSIGLRSELTTGREYRLAMAVLADASPSKAGIVFAMKPSTYGDDFFVLELRHAVGHSQLRLLHIVGTKVDELLLRELCLTRAERADFVDLSVAVTGDRIQVALGDLVTGEVRAPTEDLSGCIGCFVSGDTPYRGTVRYRDLRVE